MTRCLTGCLVAVGLATAGVSAQYPEQKPAEKSKSAQTVTIAGCVREGDTPNSFLLSNVDASALASGATGTAGTPPAGTPATAPTTTTVQLISSADIDLKKHVGHKVEVSGTISPAGAAGTTGMPSKPTTDTTAREAEKEKDKSKPAHKLNVRSVKHVSETCPM
jgi:hypothetical protein